MGFLSENPADNMKALFRSIDNIYSPFRYVKLDKFFTLWNVSIRTYVQNLLAMPRSMPAATTLSQIDCNLKVSVRY